MSSRRAPLCPAGHLPLKGGDWPSSPPSPTADVAERTPTPILPISPLEGEMPGRAEGGASHCHSLILECIG
ncbi:lytic murein transglycosylase [Mesorhizobium sp. B2-1-3]|nr:lytic murein transglycosylase [Mesorhizobium sp. B2-1-3]